MEKVNNENNEAKISLVKIIIFWAAAGFIFWIFENVVLVTPEFAVFGTWKIIQSEQVGNILAKGLLNYLLLFAAFGLIIYLLAFLLGKRLEIARGAAWQVMWCIVFQIALAGLVTTHLVILPHASAFSIIFGLAGIITLLSVILIIGIKLAAYRRDFSFWLLVPVAYISFWILQAFDGISKSWAILSGPVSYIIFLMLGLAISISMLRIYGRTPVEVAGSKLPARAIGIIAAILITVFAFYTWWMIYEGSIVKGIGKLDAGGKRPNILFIILDTVRSDHISCYGFERPTTPTIDSLAAQGVMFETVMSVSNWTLPSHASMFTSQYPGEHRATGLYKYLTNKYPTMAQILYRLGYQTVGFSANGLVGGSTGLSRGFEYFRGVGLKSKVGRIKPVWAKWLIYFREIKKPPKKKLKEKRIKTKDKTRFYPHATRMIKRVIKWFDKSRDKDRPFFMFINLMDGHLPYLPPSHKNLGIFLPDEETYQKALKVNENSKAYVAGAVDMSEEDFYLLKSLYDAQIRYMDEELKRLFNHLKDKGLWENTVVIVASDHGEFFGEHKLMGHGAGPRYATLNIPLVMANVPEIDPCTRVSSLVQNIDIFPTVLDILHVRWAGRKKLAGVSLLSPKKQRPGYAESYRNVDFIEVVSQYSKDAAKNFHCQTEVIWENGYEYVWSSNRDGELFYLPEDRREENDIAALHSDRVKRLDRDAEKRAARSTGEPENKVQINVSAEEKERLRALGYIR